MCRRTRLDWQFPKALITPPCRNKRFLGQAQEGTVADAADLGEQTVPVPVSGWMEHTITTTDDQTSEPTGAVSVAVEEGRGYRVAPEPLNTASVQVADDDIPPPPTLPAANGSNPNLPVVSIRGGASSYHEGTGVVFRVRANPAPSAPLTVKLTVSQVGGFVDNAGLGEQTVAVPASGEAFFSVQAPTNAHRTGGGSVTVSILPSDDYTVDAAGHGTATVGINDVGVYSSNIDSPASTQSENPRVGIENLLPYGYGEYWEVCFDVIARPRPVRPLVVKMRLAQEGDYLLPEHVGTYSVLVSTRGGVEFCVPSQNDLVVEPDGTITVTVLEGPGYRPSSVSAQQTGHIRDWEHREKSSGSVSLSRSVYEGRELKLRVGLERGAPGVAVMNVLVRASGDFIAPEHLGLYQVVLDGSLQSNTATLNIPTIDDDVAERTGAVNAYLLTGGVGYSRGEYSSVAYALIYDDDVDESALFPPLPPLTPPISASGPPPQPGKTDYDTDDDGLIEVANLAQLNAIRWDLDGNGRTDVADGLYFPEERTVRFGLVHDPGEHVGYESAFPNAAVNMGCPSACYGYELVADLDLDTNGNGRPDAGDAYWNSGSGWQALDSSRYGHRGFDAIFDGGGHVIANLYQHGEYNGESYGEASGLFETIWYGGEVRNLGLTRSDASSYVTKSILAYFNHGTVRNVYSTLNTRYSGLVVYNLATGAIIDSHATGSIRAQSSTGCSGGLVDVNRGVIIRSHATGNVTGFVDREGNPTGDNKGGLVGCNKSTGRIIESYATGDVSNVENSVGGLVGENTGLIHTSYATGNVENVDYNAGGLVGSNGKRIPHGYTSGRIVASYATGSVDNVDYNAGGLAGMNIGSIHTSYATGNVDNVGYYAGGLVGSNGHGDWGSYDYGDPPFTFREGSGYGPGPGTIANSFATGAVSNVRYNGGGLVGKLMNVSSATASYWDTATSQRSNSYGGVGKTTAELQAPTGYTGIYADWNVDIDGDGDTDDPWDFGSASDYPALKYGALDTAQQR